ncbi:YhgE/Pip domain-containing protein [Clostridium manihotivorum]|uniref:YhgE/Pip domain-containing protein n=1 Tax=Clostridium manihotivorum TaxID=2320868 RepID=A0A3R5U8H0_9CLOT|nr:YhgE/Pip domain-containing protein [Clostridium manihotivorum]QAA31788.1 YhgE/Pip domain-containing protein [Clostridium manihotivorum]
MSEKVNKDRRKTLFKIIVISIVAIIFVPILYSGIYLYAFWDPYGRFYDVPVAFVNLDKKVIKEGKEYNVGKDIEDNLRKNNKVGWRFVSYDEAKKGVSGTKYYALILIPEDFSKNISEAASGNLVKPTVLYEANKGKNFVFAQVSERAAESIKSEVASSIQEQTTKSLAGSLYNVKDSLSEANKGASSLVDGTVKLLNGSNQLDTGLAKAATGAKQLQSGLEKAYTGEAQLTTGVDSLLSGLNKFKGGLTQNSEGINQLVGGAKALSDGMAAVASGTSKANLSQGLTTAADSIAQIKGALNQVASILATSSDPQSIGTAQTILNGLVNTINTKKLEENLRTAAGSASSLTNNLNQLSTAASKVSAGTNTVASTLSTTQSNALSGVNQLIDGANKLKGGSQELSNGLNTAVKKTGELASGLATLNNGTKDLSNGLNSLSDGTVKLRDGLNSGYNTMNNSLKFGIEDISSFVTNPLTLSDVSINTVNYYGEGLAPYFISLSLWLGAMLMNLILSLTKLSKVVQNKYIKTYLGTFIAGSVLVMLQAVILSSVLIAALGLQPTNQFVFYLENMFISVVFFSIMYGVSYAIGVVGTPILFVLFILQLASSGGTFPIETAPGFFRVLSPFFPMTYTVEGLRMIISGINSIRLTQISFFLLTFMLIFLISGFVVNRTFKGLKSIKAEEE